MKNTNAQKTTASKATMIQSNGAKTMIVMETQDLVNHRITLSVLTNREVLKLSPSELLANTEVLNRLSVAEIARVQYLVATEQLEKSKSVICVEENDDDEIAFAKAPVTKIVVEHQDLVNHRIVLSVLHNRELQKLSPAAVLANPEILNGLTKAEISRVTYLFGVEQDDAQFAKAMGIAKTRAPKAVARKKAPLSKIMIEKQDLVADDISFTVLHERDLVKLSPMALLRRSDILGRLNKQEVGRTAYLAGVEFEILKSRAEALMA